MDNKKLYYGLGIAAIVGIIFYLSKKKPAHAVKLAAPISDKRTDATPPIKGSIQDRLKALDEHLAKNPQLQKKLENDEKLLVAELKKFGITKAEFEQEIMKTLQAAASVFGGVNKKK